MNLPQFRYNDTYQVQNNFTQVRGDHMLKAGFDVRYQYVKSFFFPTIRGLLRYPTLNAFVNDVAEAANINKPLPGGEEINYYRWWDQYYFVQDDWRVASNLTLNLGVRYELPGNNIQSLIDLNEQILQVNNNNQVFALEPGAGDRHEQLPAAARLQLVSRRRGPRASSGRITGGDRFVIRGGYARTHDFAFLNIALNIVSSFPYVAAINRSNLANAFTRAAVDAGGRAGRDRPESADQDGCGGRLPGAGRTTSSALKGSGRSARPRAARRLRRDVRQRSVPDARRQPAAAVQHAAAGSDRAASSGCARTRPSRGTTRCRRSSTSGSAAA